MTADYAFWISGRVPPALTAALAPLKSVQTSADTLLALGDEVRVPPVRMAEPALAGGPAAPAREFVVLFEDEHLLAIAKPSGVAVHGGSGVAFGVIEQLRRARPAAKFLELVHRLDKDTSGVLLLAKKRSALLALQDQFRNRDTDWQLWVEVGKRPIPRKMVITSKTLNSAPQYTLRIKTWNTDIGPVPAAFVFAPPANAQKLGAHALIGLDELPPEASTGEKK